MKPAVGDSFHLIKISFLFVLDLWMMHSASFKPTSRVFLLQQNVILFLILPLNPKSHPLLPRHICECELNPLAAPSVAANAPFPSPRDSQSVGGVVSLHRSHYLNSSALKQKGRDQKILTPGRVGLCFHSDAIFLLACLNITLMSTNLKFHLRLERFTLPRFSTNKLLLQNNSEVVTLRWTRCLSS